MRRVLIISNSKLERDPRVYRQVAALQDQWEVDVVANGPIETLRCRKIADFVDQSLFVADGQGFASYLGAIGGRLTIASALIAFVAHRVYVKGGRKSKIFGALENRMYWRISHLKRFLRHRLYDLVLANDFHALPLAFSLNRRAPVIFDAHEYSPGQFRGGFFGKFRAAYTSAILKRYIPRCDAMMTVSDGLAELYEKEFGLKPSVAWNGPVYHDLQLKTVAAERIRLVHSGLIDPKRKIESMIELMRLLDPRFELDLYLVGDTESAYYRYLRDLADSIGRVNFPPPVAMVDLVRTLNDYDIGITLLKPETINHTYGLPNKFFDFVQARLAVASWPRVEIKRIIDRHGLGVCTDDFSVEAMAKVLNALTADDVMRMKSASHAAAKELSSEAAKKLVVELAERLSS